MLVMTVEPGFGGQQFMDKMVPRIERFRSLIDKKNPKCLLEVDGGINGETAPVAVKAGADVVVAGNYIFSKGSPGKNLKKLRSLFDSID